MINVRSWQCVIVIACALVSCVEEFDTTRRPHREAGLGDTVYEVLCNRLAIRENPWDVSGKTTRALCQGTGTPGAGTSARLKALHSNRARLIQALDATFGIDSAGAGVHEDAMLASDMRTLLDNMLPLYDNGLMEQHNAALGPWMEQLRDASVARTLAAQSSRERYHQGVVQNANHEFTLPTAALPILMRFDKLVDLGVAFDKAFGEGAPDADLFIKWLAQAQAALRDYEPSTRSGFLLDYMLRENERLDGDKLPLYSVLRDPKGDATRLTEHSSAELDSLQKAPFGEANSALDSVYTRDDYGRLQQGGKLIYAYQDLNKTPLAAGMRLVHQWMEKLNAPAAQDVSGSPKLCGGAQAARDSDAPTLLDGAAWLRAVLQGEADTSRATNKLADADASSPVLDAMAALQWLAKQDAITGFLPLARTLWDENEAEVVRLIQLFASVGHTFDAMGMQKHALTPGNTLIDDLIDVAQQMAAHPGLFDRVIRALMDPATAKLGPLLATHMNTTDDVDYDHVDLRSSRAIGDFKTPVDRTKADVRGNQSVFQRLMHLVHDAYGLPIVNMDDAMNYESGELFQIDDAALFYLRSIVGKARMTLCAREDETGMIGMGGMPYSFIEAETQGPPGAVYGYAYVIESLMGLSGVTPETPTQAEQDRCAAIVNHKVDPETHEVVQHNHIAYTYKVSPQAAARMLFTDPKVLEAYNAEQMAQGRDAYSIGLAPATMYEEPFIDGVSFRQLHGRTLFAWEKHGFHEAITPLLAAFAQPDPGAEEGNEKLFLELLNVLHKHWSTPNSNVTQNDDKAREDYAAQTGLSQFEPLLAFTLQPPQPKQGLLDLLAPIVSVLYDDSAWDEEDESAFLDDMGSSLSETPVGGALEAALGVVQNASPAAQAPFVDTNTLLARGGAVVRMTDGVTPIAHPAPAHILNHLAHHVAVQSQHLEQSRPGAGRVFGTLLDTFSETNAAGTQLKNRETHALVSGFLDYMCQHLAEMGENLRNNAQEILGNPLLVSSLEMMAAFGRVDPEVGQQVQALVTHLVSDTQRPALVSAAANSLYTAADTKVDLQPLAQALAGALDYPNGTLPLTLKLASATSGVDTQSALPRVMTNLGRPLPSPGNQIRMSETPIDVFIDVYQQINRVSPEDANALTANDHIAIIDSLANFLQDEKHGFVRLLQLIKHRHGN